MDVEGLTKKIRHSFRKLCGSKKQQYEDDCVQAVLLSYLEGTKGQAVDFAVVDYLRKEFGSSRSLKGDARSKAVRLDYEDFTSVIAAHEECDSVVWEGLLENISKMNIPERVKFILKARIVGFTYGEISTVLGITESRVQQIAAKFLERARSDMTPFQIEKALRKIK